ncbi:hypothetical protein ACIRFH_32550 [Streptomyces sp. NPDC093586]|uniref:hypothetical protein n=1 Tax=Streptomyces sp. NPDC093586 TaxID=3366042 RepID=UPI0038106BB1
MSTFFDTMSIVSPQSQRRKDAHPAPTHPEVAHALDIETTAFEQWARTARKRAERRVRHGGADQYGPDPRRLLVRPVTKAVAPLPSPALGSGATALLCAHAMSRSSPASTQER